MKIKLKCPDCGSDNLHQKMYSETDENWIHCDNCGWVSEVFTNKKEQNDVCQGIIKP